MIMQAPLLPLVFLRYRSRAWKRQAILDRSFISLHLEISTGVDGERWRHFQCGSSRR
jgi:hypothetical protein